MIAAVSGGSSSSKDEQPGSSSSSSSSEQSSQKLIKIILQRKQQQQHSTSGRQLGNEATAAATRSENEVEAAAAAANSLEANRINSSTDSKMLATKSSDLKQPPQPTASVCRTASARIQQRQQRFLAAAAKSATSPTTSDISSPSASLSSSSRLTRQQNNNNRQQTTTMTPTTVAAAADSSGAAAATSRRPSFGGTSATAAQVVAPTTATSQAATITLSASPASTTSSGGSYSKDLAAAPSESEKENPNATPTTTTTSTSSENVKKQQDHLIGQQQQHKPRSLVINGASSRAVEGFATTLRQQLPSSSLSSWQQHHHHHHQQQQQQQHLLTNKHQNQQSSNNYCNSANNYNHHHQQYHPHHQYHYQYQHQQPQHHHNHQSQYQHQQQNNNNNYNINTSQPIPPPLSTTTALAQATTTHQQQTTQSPTMSHHYKFHNDCQSSVLTYEQVKRLDFVMDQTVPIHGRGNFPTLYVKLKELIRLVKHKLQKEHSIEIRDVRLNGGGANYVLAPENSHYNDLDLVFGTDLSNEDQFDVIRDVVLECLKEFYPKEPVSSTTTAAAASSSYTSSTVAYCPQHSSSNRVATANRCCVSSSSSNESHLSGTSTSETGSGSSSEEMIPTDEEKGDYESRQACDKIDKEPTAHVVGDNKKEGKQLTKTMKELDSESVSAPPTAGAAAGASPDNHHQQHTISVGCGERTTAEVAAASTAGSGCCCSGLANLISAKQQQSNQMPLNNCAIKEAYVHKMVKVNDDDRWSLISLGVQQSEVNGAGQQQQQQVSNGAGPLIAGHAVSESYFPALPPTEKNLEDHQAKTNSLNNKLQTGIGGGGSSGEVLVSGTNNVGNHQHNHYHHHNPQPQQHQINHHYQQQQQQHRPKQFPNSIELKFVDRMRRKFEFSVDSFQIILDSLIQFYDYAPKPSSMASQRDLMNSHPSSTVINTRPMIMSKRRCSIDCCSANADCLAANHRMESNFDGYNKVRIQRGSFSAGSSNNCQPSKSGSQCRHHSSSLTQSSPSDNEFNVRSMATRSQSYYQFQLDAQSPSLTSEASSSGCSSSSSVVSSSSSSLSSCDEDNEDLYCDVDGQSSSSASTSSLLSSSVYSSDDGVACGSAPDQQRPSSSGCDGVINSSKSIKKQSTAQQPSESSKITCNKVSASKAFAVKGTTARNSAPVVDDAAGTSTQRDGCCVGCCPDLTNSYGDNEYDFETDDSTSCAVISENFYPTVIGRSEYGNFKEALYHLEKKLIATRSPEEIRGGGLLKYCNLLVKNYKPTNVYQIRTLERYMCSRFFIDFSDLNQQQAKLESYLANHFSDDLLLKIDYLTILHNVVQRSTVCLMNHELRLTLEMIRDMAFKMSEQQQQQQQHPQLQHRQGHFNNQHPYQHQQRASAAQLMQPSQTTPVAAAQFEMVSAAQQQPLRQKNQQQHVQQAKQFFGDQPHHPPASDNKPLLIQSGAYRVKLVNYSLAKPAATATATK